MTAARRLAAILAADVAGYSRLMGEDEAGPAKAVRERREAATPIVQVLGGRLVKTTGDGVLLEFPSVVAAVECAILIQKMMAVRNEALTEAKRIRYRIGVNRGDVLIDGDDILGDGVNVAARLEGICEPGCVCVSGSAYEQIQGRVVAAFADFGDQSLKNIAKPVRVYALPPGAIDEANVETPEAVQSAPASPLPAQPREPPHLSIVVLPFANIGGDPEQEYFVDGVTESLTTDLSRISGAFVIGRSTAFTYKAKPVDLKQIGRELNVRYVLEGSMQRVTARMRVNVQLIEAETGAHLWAERFDKPTADLFEMQDEIVARLASQIRAELVEAEARRAEQTPNPESMDLYFRGQAWVNKGWSPEYMAQARTLFERSIALDAGNVDVLVGAASVSAIARTFFLDDRRARIADAEAILTRTLSLASDHALAHAWMGDVQIFMGRISQGIAARWRSIVISPWRTAASGSPRNSVVGPPRLRPMFRRRCD
jgi:TolB-like protein/class 3 adenylate cyclase